MRKHRHTLDLTPEMDKLLKAMADQRGITLSEVLRRAIALYRAAENAHANGGEICEVRGGAIYARYVWF